MDFSSQADLVHIGAANINLMDLFCIVSNFVINIETCIEFSSPNIFLFIFGKALWSTY